MSTTLTIGLTDYAAADRAAAQIEIDSWGWDLDSDLSAEFHETRQGAMGPRFHCGQSVGISVSGTARFVGEIAEVVPTFGPHGWTYGYRCLGPKYQARNVWVTQNDGTGLVVYNLPPDDQDYIAANSGLSVGTIISDLFTLHASALSALGITTDATTTSQLALLTVVPNEPVYLSGRLMQAVDGLLQRWARNVKSHYTADGVARFYDTTAPATTLTLTLGTDPVDPPCFSRSTRECAPRVAVRGKGKIYPGYVSLGRSSLTKAWSAGQQSSWTYTDFSQPNDAFDYGTVNSVDSATQVTVQSHSGTETWATNFWNGREAWIYLQNSLGSALTYQEARPVTACSALTAGGTATITLGFDLENAGSSAYNQYQLIGKVDDLSGSSSSNRNSVWRLYDVTDPGSLIADHLVAKFPTPVPFINYSGTATGQTNYPEAVIVKGLVAWPATFKVMPQTGQILFDEPVVKALNTQSTLNTGGAGVTAPDDIYCLLAYSRGALTSTYPADVGGVPQYAGTSYTVDGIQQTLYVDVESWVYQGNQSLMDAYAEMIWKSISDTIVTGSISYRGAWTAAFAPDLALNVAGNGFTTGLESLGVPIRSFTLRYHADGAGGMNYTSHAGCSSRRNPRTGDTLYLHTTQLSQTGFNLNLGGLAGFGAAMAGFGAGIAASTSFADVGSAAGAAMGAQGGLVGGAIGGVEGLAQGAMGLQAGLVDSTLGQQSAMAGFDVTGQEGMGEGIGGFGDFGMGDDGGPVGISRGRKPKRSKPRKYLSRAEAIKQRQAQYRPPAPQTAEDVAKITNEAEPDDTTERAASGPAGTVSAAAPQRATAFTGQAPPKDLQARIRKNKLARRPKTTRKQALAQSNKARAESLARKQAEAAADPDRFGSAPAEAQANSGMVPGQGGANEDVADTGGDEGSDEA